MATVRLLPATRASRFVYVLGTTGTISVFRVEPADRLIPVQEFVLPPPKPGQDNANWRLVAHGTKPFLYAARIGNNAVVVGLRVLPGGRLQLAFQVHPDGLEDFVIHPSGHFCYGPSWYGTYDDFTAVGYKGENVARWQIKPNGFLSPLRPTRATIMDFDADWHNSTKNMVFDATGRYMFNYFVGHITDSVSRDSHVFRVLSDGSFVPMNIDFAPPVKNSSEAGPLWAYDDYGTPIFDPQNRWAFMTGYSGVVVRHYRGNGQLGALAQTGHLPSVRLRKNEARYSWVMGIDPSVRLLYCGEEYRTFGRNDARNVGTVYTFSPTGHLGGPVFSAPEMSLYPDAHGTYAYGVEKRDAGWFLVLLRADAQRGTVQRKDAVPLPISYPIDFSLWQGTVVSVLTVP